MANSFTKYVERNGDNPTYSTDLQALSEAAQSIMQMLPFKNPSILGNYDSNDLSKVGIVYYNGQLYNSPDGITNYPEDKFLYVEAKWDETSTKTVVSGTTQVTYQQRIVYQQKIEDTAVANVNNGDGTGKWQIGELTGSNLSSWREGILGNPNLIATDSTLLGDAIIPGTLDGDRVKSNTLLGDAIADETIDGTEKIANNSISLEKMAQYNPQCIVDGWVTASNSVNNYSFVNLVSLSGDWSEAYVKGINATADVVQSIILNVSTLSLRNTPDTIVIPILLKNKAGVVINISPNLTIAGNPTQNVPIIITSTVMGSNLNQIYGLTFKKITTNGYMFMGYYVAESAFIIS